MNSDLYGKTFVLPEEVVNYLQQCFDSANGASQSNEGYRRNIELRSYLPTIKKNEKLV